jgi:porphobilinogen synthase
MAFPIHRPRRLRKNETIREMVRETRLSPSDFIVPLFAVHGSRTKKPIDALPDNYHLSIDMLVDEAKLLRDIGVPAVLIFGIPKGKDLAAPESFAPDGISQLAIEAIKKGVPDMIVIADTCMSMYTPNGFSGIVENGKLLNDPSLKILAKIALAQAQAGADMLAPSAMLDGQIKTMREALDANGFSDTAIMAYAAKYASCLYDPFFKQGAGPAVDYTVKKTHQMDIGNSDEAMREIALDVEEGADIIMVKPGLFYLDIVFRAKQEFDLPLAVYNVSGEYAMMAAAEKLGFLNKKDLIIEALLSCKRAGADMIITYCAKEAAAILRA